LRGDLTADDIAAGDLADVKVLVVPNGDADDAFGALGAEGRQALVDWAPDVVAHRRAGELAERSESVQQADDAMVLTVRPDAADEVRALLDEHDADVEVVRAGGKSVGFRIDLGGTATDDHPWAVTLAQDVAELGEDVVAIRLP
jgi:hypothetical protein